MNRMKKQKKQSKVAFNRCDMRNSLEFQRFWLTFTRIHLHASSINRTETQFDQIFFLSNCVFVIFDRKIWFGNGFFHDSVFFLRIHLKLLTVNSQVNDMLNASPFLAVHFWFWKHRFTLLFSFLIFFFFVIVKQNGCCIHSSLWHSVI